MDIIPYGTLQDLGFYFSLLGYLELGAPQFIDVINNPDLTIEPVNNNLAITNFEVEKVKKQNKYAAKRKARLNNLCDPVRALAASSAALFLSCPTLVFYCGSFAPLLSCLESPTFLSLLFACPETAIALLSCLVPAPVPEFLAVLLFLSMLDLTLPHLVSTAAKIFKQVLSDKLFHSFSTSLTELPHPFPPLGLLLDKTKCKQTFDTVFITTCPLASNHAQKEVDLRFAKCGCFAAVKLNRS